MNPTIAKNTTQIWYMRSDKRWPAKSIVEGSGRNRSISGCTSECQICKSHHSKVNPNVEISHSKSGTVALDTGGVKRRGDANVSACVYEV